MAQIYEAIQAILSEMPAIGKERKNQQQGFQYRGIDDVMNALNPLLSRHGVFCTPEVLERHREERETKSGGILAFTTLTVKYTFYAMDGSNISCVVVGEGMDSGDKSTNKALAVAMKYAMFQVFCIPTEEMMDPDAETPEELSAKSAKGKQKGAQQEAQKAVEAVTAIAKRKALLKELGDKYGVSGECMNGLKKDLIKEKHIADKKYEDYTENEFLDLLVVLEQRIVETGFEEAV